VAAPQHGEGSPRMPRLEPAPMLLEMKGDLVRNEPNNESLMEETGLGLLPGVVLALAIVVFSMALLLSGSIWAVIAVLVVVALVTASILAVVIALIDEGELGDRLRRYIPGLPAPPRA
jgi:VIT1/CCC1 family predicted Fe2+/Mn2+ transporter